MADQKPLFKSPYDIKDVSALFAIVAFVLIISAIIGNNLFGLFQDNINFGSLGKFFSQSAKIFLKFYHQYTTGLKIHKE